MTSQSIQCTRATYPPQGRGAYAVLMTLQPLSLELPVKPLDERVTLFLAEADRRINSFLISHPPVPGFVPSDFERVWAALRSLRDGGQLTGRRFLEWGSGMGVAACLARLLEFECSGIEVEPDLVMQARRLAQDHQLDVTFVCGTLVPDGRDEVVEAHTSGEVDWLVDGAEPGYDELGHELDDFDIVFAYPWPGEEGVLKALFDADAASGAVLCLYEGREDVSAWRRV